MPGLVPLPHPQRVVFLDHYEALLTADVDGKGRMFAGMERLVASLHGQLQVLWIETASAQEDQVLQATGDEQLATGTLTRRGTPRLWHKYLQEVIGYRLFNCLKRLPHRKRPFGDRFGYVPAIPGCYESSSTSCTASNTCSPSFGPRTFWSSSREASCTAW